MKPNKDMIRDDITRAYFKHINFKCIHDRPNHEGFCDECPLVHLAVKENRDISYYCDFVKHFTNDDDAEYFKIHFHHVEAKVDENSPGFILYSCEEKEIYKNGIYHINTGISLEMSKKLIVSFGSCKATHDVFGCITEPFGYKNNNRMLSIGIKAHKQHRIISGDILARMTVLYSFPENKVVKCYHS